MTADLIDFIRARLDDDAAMARHAFGDHNDGGPEWNEISSGLLDAGGELHGIGDSAVSRHMARWDPARVLAEVDARRRIIAEFDAELSHDTAALIDTTLRLLALPYATHPDYRAEWRP